jgi:hypothetical protein
MTALQLASAAAAVYVQVARQYCLVSRQHQAVHAPSQPVQHVASCLEALSCLL